MAKKTYSQTITDTQVLIQGIRLNLEVLSKRQINGTFADALQADILNSVRLNGEQESLKAQLKQKSAELDAALAAVNKKAGEARKIIKMDMPQASWREFGIEDKR